ncbi:hypothetical protein [Motilibacter deserti]|uniref:AbiEi antitoxin of type IV toxin-antitoxin system n=1 Tax=Motilibacter deserti TaxID=2714956 RepID=A0ABX0GP99_9ACTN|nr:hypothetical protein [Motilibacter deserti]NHC12671.1 hypothetical protein [Motilibacter deserti]
MQDQLELAGWSRYTVPEVLQELARAGGLVRVRRGQYRLPAETESTTQSAPAGAQAHVLQALRDMALTGNATPTAREVGGVLTSSGRVYTARTVRLALLELRTGPDAAVQLMADGRRYRLVPAQRS